MGWRCQLSAHTSEAAPRSRCLHLQNGHSTNCAFILDPKVTFQGVISRRMLRRDVKHPTISY